ncbi:unnamed protein product [Blepharisma stoltei]|uniref:Ankyrin repeat domain-containing protein n=1 Tax=Blepharisma stoltei TaxID=1481888 RepID=A0AAU9JX62_9CILI|nr:unnamed protein product [Blepharisma stoltei]
MDTKDRIIKELQRHIHELSEENKLLKQTVQHLQCQIKELESKVLSESPKINSSNQSENPPTAEHNQEVLQHIEMDNLSFFQSLISSGLSVDHYFNELGTFLIHEAVKSGAIKIIHYLASRCNLNNITADGETPLTLGAELDKHDSICMLLQTGRDKVDLEHKNKQGLTALQIAVKKGNKEIVGLLLEHGADITVTTVLGDSLLRLAQHAGHQELVLLLANSGASLR